jgi:hypothetical protein
MEAFDHPLALNVHGIDFAAFSSGGRVQSVDSGLLGVVRFTGGTSVAARNGLQTS